ncbi:hypothetical protein [Acetobacterium wieringae]|uniref:DUF4435 domain-containing protein n=1 Tax=Acetobacterium wieringae TaxID=52694 RepID=A0A1F2PCD4_9FIRM|nr:hypothetical protein [Acetobacterium wieringae]OFV68908.1 hypothetical protein ACWI_35990 [Acetobacterium wieringae]
MAANSIRIELDKNAIINDINFMQSVDIYKQDIYLIVEGLDDLSFIQSKVTNSVYLYESFSGKNGVREIVDYFDNNYRVIGLYDRDYEQIETIEKHFYYDHNCLEMMIAKNETVFSSVCSEYYRGLKSSTEILEDVFFNLRFLGELRKLNHDSGAGFKFSKFSFDGCIDEHCYLNHGNVISKIKTWNPNRQHHFYMLDEFCNTYDTAECFDHDYYFDIINGHDFISFLCYSIYFHTNKSKSKEDIASSFRCAYRLEDFQSTILFENLRSYEQEKHLHILINC